MNMIAQEIELSALQEAPGGVPLGAAATMPFLRSVKVKVTVRLGQTETTVGELLDMKPGSVLSLDRMVDQPLDVLIDEHVVARGTLVAVGDQFGIRLSEPPNAAAGPAAR